MMDYDKLYYPKIEMSQTVPTTTGNSQIPDPYAVYADSFDLSLLPSTSPFTTITAPATSIASDDVEISLSTTQSKFTLSSLQSSSLSLCSSSSSSSSFSLSPTRESSPESPLVTIDYIPATIYHEQSIKLEKSWNQKDQNTNAGHNNNKNINNNNNCEDKITVSAISHYQTSSSSDTTILLQQFQKHYQFYPSPLPSPPQESSASATITSGGIGGGGGILIYPPSPCPSIEQNHQNFQTFQNFKIKQEFHILPPSPPESNGAPSPAACCIDIKSEPETDTSETFLDISSLLENSITSSPSSHSLSQQRESLSSFSQQQQNPKQQQKQSQNQQTTKKPAQDHQLLREYLQDTTFQKKHNLKPLALESLFGGFGVRADIEPVISLALEHAKRDAQATCALLKISPDPRQWTTSQVHAWIRSTIEQFKLPSNNDIEMKFPENGLAFMCLSEDEFNRRVPEAGSTIHAQLEIWKLACSENFSSDFGGSTTILSPSTINGSLNNSNSTWNSHTNCSDTMNMDISDDEDEEMIPISAISIHHHHDNDNTSNVTSVAIPLGRTPPPLPPPPSMVTATSSSTNNNEINSTTSLLTPSTQQITSTVGATVDINGTVTTTSAGTGTATLLSSTSTKTSSALAATAVTALTTAAATPSTVTNPAAATTTKSGTRPGGSHIHLWQFLKELLASPQLHGTAIRWLDRSKGVFKIEDSVRVAKLWGRRKNRPAMNYDKLSRSIRQYYKKGIMKKTERSQRLVYQFCHPYSL